MRIGLTQEEFAKLGGVSRVSQHLYESGKRAPVATYLLRLAAHGVSLDHLLHGRSSRPSTIPRELLLSAFGAVDRVCRDEAGTLRPLEDRARQFLLLVESLAAMQADGNPL